MDRSILEADPHAVLEGLTIAGRAVGAHKGYIYVRAEYPLAVDRLKIAIEQAKEYGLLGENILDTGFHFDISMKKGAGAFVCGEETALMASIEGEAEIVDNQGDSPLDLFRPQIRSRWGRGRRSACR